MGKIASIVFKPAASRGEDDADHYLRVQIEGANLVTGHGIEGDRKGGHPSRQLNIMSADALRSLGEDGFAVGPGQLGEQIVLDGLDVQKLSPGDRIFLGDEACVEVIEKRTGCDRFEHIQGKSRLQADGRLGVIARVVAGGRIEVGSPVRAEL